MKLSNLTKAELIARLNHAERNTPRALFTRFKREALLLGRDLSRLVSWTYELGSTSRNQLQPLLVRVSR